MQILHVCAEMFPLLKTGGLADVSGALPIALRPLGADVRVLLPGFPAIMQGLDISGEVVSLHSFAGELRILFGQTAEGVGVYVIDAPHLYARGGNPYQDGNQHPYSDNHVRFAVLGWVAARLAEGVDPFWRPSVVHAHDWHAGLAPAYIAAVGHPARTVFTIHNLAYQGVFSPSDFAAVDLPAHFFSVNGVEFHGHLSFMKAGIYFADRVTTVSPTYAHEIAGAEQGCGLDGLLRDRGEALSGVLNGVDDAIWNPANDALIATSYSAEKPTAKAKCKAALQLSMGLQENSDAPLFAVVSRLTEQKGLHLVLERLHEITSRGGQFVLLGSGDANMEAAFRVAAAANPTQIAVKIGYDEAFSHQIMAGSDVIMVPSRFEPCGLTQLYGLKYGALPLVRRVGGLADTVVDCSLENLQEGIATGAVFDGFSGDELARGIRRMFALWARPKEWKAVRKTAMSRDFAWHAAAEQYLQLYRALGA
ncbi:glycogen synthase GlgA [Chitinibacter bivalviorum]|uniref:Glycogen synthase n=1 Tax=Chitinibacter bivalviorum TaxID=2739434 RepID=A0A7H9BJ77_9NEIS|nr:glycogen synthase GlgA [Chitinibacter bivalviorum]QLG88298.1 glycogen synthase GlgA [Chitinibacter bivalviorum]